MSFQKKMLVCVHECCVGLITEVAKKKEWFCCLHRLSDDDSQSKENDEESSDEADKQSESTAPQNICQPQITPISTDYSSFW